MILLICSPLAAQNESHGFRYQTAPDLDGWSLGHIGFGGVSYIVPRLFGASPKTSMIICAVVAYGYEIICDGYQTSIGFHGSDPDGADLVGDPVCNILGGLFCMFAEYFWRLDDRVHLTYSNDTLTFAFTL
jgi:hypothetical protein